MLDLKLNYSFSYTLTKLYFKCKENVLKKHLLLYLLNLMAFQFCLTTL